MTTHAPIHTTREAFFDRANWTVSKKGNPYIRDHGHTYTMKMGPYAPGEEAKMPITVVAVRFDGERRDFGPFSSPEEMIDELWPEGESSPKGVP